MTSTKSKRIPCLFKHELSYCCRNWIIRLASRAVTKLKALRLRQMRFKTTNSCRNINLIYNNHGLDSASYNCNDIDLYNSVCFISQMMYSFKSFVIFWHAGQRNPDETSIFVSQCRYFWLSSLFACFSLDKRELHVDHLTYFYLLPSYNLFAWILKD